MLINVADHGIMPNTGKSVTAEVNRLIESIDGSKSVKIVFPKGRYDFRPSKEWQKEYFESNTFDNNPKNLAVFLKDKKNIIIEGSGSEFVCHGHIQPFTLDNSENIVIRNVNVDWDIPTTAQGEVMVADSKRIVLKIDKKQFPYDLHAKNGLTFKGEDWTAEWGLSEGSWLMEFDKNHLIPPFTGQHGCVKRAKVNGKKAPYIYKELSPGMVEITSNYKKLPKVGNFLVLRHSSRDHAGGFFFHSKDIKMENVNIYHTAGLGLLFQYCENITLENVAIVPNPKKNRYLSGHDDGFHIMGCKGDILINKCSWEGLMDDPINIHGTAARVVKRVDNRTLRCTFAHGMSAGMIWAQPGDAVGFIDKDPMVTIGKGEMTKFTKINKKEFTLEFKDDLPKEVQKEFSLENLTFVPNATITNCFVGSCRARGFLISTQGKVIVANNTFQTSGSAILIAGDASQWYETGCVKDVLIENNVFRSPCNSSHYQFCNAVISIYPEVHKPDPQRPYHRNIRLKNNIFQMADHALLYALSVDGLTFSDNKIERSTDFEPWRSNTAMFALDACKNVDLTNNTYKGEVLGMDITFRRMKKEEIKAGDKLKFK